MARKQKSKFPRLVLADLNAAIGSVQAAGIGSHGEATENKNGKGLRKLIAETSTIAPAIFEKYHHGRTTTFTSPSGADSRKDYILIDRSLEHGIVSSFVDENIDLTFSRQDHQVVCVELSLSKKVGVTDQGIQLPGFDAKRLREPRVLHNLKDLLAAIPHVPWAIEPDGHANLITWQL